MVRFPNERASEPCPGDVFDKLQGVERQAQRDAESLAQRVDPYAKARVEITLKVLEAARQTKQRLAKGDVALGEAAVVASDLHELLLPYVRSRSRFQTSSTTS